MLTVVAKESLHETARKEKQGEGGFSFTANEFSSYMGGKRGVRGKGGSKKKRGGDLQSGTPGGLKMTTIRADFN